MHLYLVKQLKTYLKSTHLHFEILLLIYFDCSIIRKRADKIVWIVSALIRTSNIWFYSLEYHPIAIKHYWNTSINVSRVHGCDCSYILLSIKCSKLSVSIRTGGVYSVACPENQHLATKSKCQYSLLYCYLNFLQFSNDIICLVDFLVYLLLSFKFARSNLLICLQFQGFLSFRLDMRCYNE